MTRSIGGWGKTRALSAEKRHDSRDGGNLGQHKISPGKAVSRVGQVRTRGGTTGIQPEG